ncbi:MAG: ATP-grasp fold amidoligase family protein [Candidatus Woesearchaeota archaeon]
MEWAYKNVKRKIIIEKFLKDKNGQSPKDYKFHMFHGKCKMIQVDSDRFKKHTRSLFDENWNYIDASLKFTQGKKLTKPKNLENMKKLAEKLSKNFENIRIDLYSLNDNIFVGELTQYHGSGTEKFKPIKYDFELGKNWKIKKTIGRGNDETI